MPKSWSTFGKIVGTGEGKKPLSELPYYRVETQEQKCHKCSKWKPLKGNYSTGQRTPLGVDRTCLKCKSKVRRYRYAETRPYSPRDVYEKSLEGLDVETLALFFHTGRSQITRMLRSHEASMRKGGKVKAKGLNDGVLRKSQIGLTDGMWLAIDDAVDEGHYPNRSEFIRQAIREKLNQFQLKHALKNGGDAALL